jgi:N-acetylglucosaminyl-diphospho-decaprenol L-rhamnosyltransferase
VWCCISIVFILQSPCVNHLLHPDLVQSIPVLGDRAAIALDQRATETLVDDPALDTRITVAVRTFNEAPKLELLLQDVGQQAVGSEVEIVVVDNESTDHTRAIAKEYNAEIVTLPRGEFTYPRSMNLCMEAASHNAVFLTVAHAQLSTRHTLHAGARHLKPNSNVAGVYAFELPMHDSSRTDKWIRAVNALELFRPPRRIHNVGMAVMGAAGAFFSKTAWRELGRFDERYQTGGEDTAMARAMLAAGYGIVKEPALAVHHSHGLGPLATAREFIHYAKTVRGPQALDGNMLTMRRARFGDK